MASLGCVYYYIMSVNILNIQMPMRIPTYLRAYIHTYIHTNIRSTLQ